MKKIIYLLVVLLSSGSVFAANSCVYCTEMDSLMKKFKEIKPDPMDEKTIDAQFALVERASKLLVKIVRLNNGHPKDEDVVRFVTVIAKAVEYDGENSLGDDIVDALGKNADTFFAQLRRLRDTHKAPQKQVEEAITAIAMAENTRENGDSDDSDAKKNE